MHLTNFAINKQNEDFQHGDGKDDEGHKRSLISILKQLEADGFSCDKIMNSIADIIIKTIITVQPSLSHIYRSCQADDYENSMIFEILGFDIFIDSKGKPYLIEVNHSPSFHANSALDDRIKRGLIKDTLRLLNLNTQRKSTYIKKHAEEFQKRMLTGKQLKYTPEERKMLARAFEEDRNAWESENLGHFKLIYPSGPDSYKRFLKQSKSVWEEFNFGYKPQMDKKRKKKVSHKRAISYSTVQKKAIAQLSKGVNPEKINKDALRDLQRKRMFGCLKKKD